MRVVGTSLPTLVGILLSTLPAIAQDTPARTTFHVKYIASGIVYLDGGRAAGLIEGQKLIVRRSEPKTGANGTATASGSAVVAELTVASVAEASAVCEIRSASGELRVGDVAILTETQKPAQPPIPSGTARKYPVVISFSEGDPLDEEARAAVPRPPLSEINRARGRVGVEYSAIAGLGDSSLNSRQVGLVLRMDMTRIGGTYWSFTGYWRGRLNSRSSAAQPQTLNDLISRTYHLGFTYSSPRSPWTAGLGRLYVPWATSLSTLDGGYVGRRVGRVTTFGAFVGSTPDPTSWNYNPDRRLAGALVNFEGGSFDAVRVTSTLGLALSTIGWRTERRFVFAENGFFLGHTLSLYHSVEADAARTVVVTSSGVSGGSTPSTITMGAGLSRSFLTVRFQPSSRLTFDVNHNYFRDVPTFDPQLIGTGLLDKLLFQGLSGGIRMEPIRKLILYANVGRSSSTGDARNSWNQLYGVTLGQIWKTGIRTDVRYSKFDSSFGRGSYRALLFSREFGEELRVEVQAGLQNYVSSFTQQTNGRYVTSLIDWAIGQHMFLETGCTLQRGGQMNYNQWFVTLGRRFGGPRRE